jgi:hypothetical protein
VEDLLGLVVAVFLVSYPYLIYKVWIRLTTPYHYRIAQEYESQRIKAHKKIIEARRAQRRREVAIQEGQKRIETTKHEVTHFGLAKGRIIS